LSRHDQRAPVNLGAPGDQLACGFAQAAKPQASFPAYHEEAPRMTSRRMLLGYLAGAALAATAALGLAQTGERPLHKFFGSGPGKNSPPKTSEDLRRKAEIDVELAWLADPVTFPYYLEAQADATTLTVRGYVPDPAVRDHALK